MAIVKNFWLKNQTKKLAGAVIYQAMGQTRSRELAAEVSNPRTVDQMTQRVKWANLVNFYRANKSWMRFAFETKPTNRTDYNQFMSMNVSNSRIYLPKQIANQGGCVVDSYLMTQGSLASIEILPMSNDWQTNIYTPGLVAGVTTYTIAEVSRAILSANPAIREGDQISFIRMTQQTNSTSGVPYVVVRKYEVLVNTSDLRQFFDFMPQEIIDFGGASGSEAIIIKNTNNAGGFLMCLSRTVGGKTYVSTQNVVVANNSALIDAYSSNSALQAAIDSYGESTEPFLTSTTAELDTQAAISASILSAEVDGEIGVPGTQFLATGIDTDSEVRVKFNKLVTGTFTSMSMQVYSGGRRIDIPLTPDELADGEALGIVQQIGNPITNFYVESIYCTIDGVDYRAAFLVPNSATTGGLE